MAWETIHKTERAPGQAANLGDYDETYRTFSWSKARAELDGLPGGGLNIAHEAVDRHVAKGRGGRTALVWLDKDGDVHAYSYSELAELSNRFAGALLSLGVARGERVFALLGRMPELYVAALGTWKLGAVFCPLFSAFGPEPIRARMAIGTARALVTTEPLYRKKLMPWRADMQHLTHVLLQ